jgi:hypothetical protein
MGTGKQQTSLAVKALVEQAVQVIAQAGELEHVPVAAEQVLQAEAELETVQVVAEPELVQAEAELEHVPVAAEPEQGVARVAAEPEQGIAPAEEVLGIVPVEEVRELDRPPARPAVAPRTKSVTAAPPHDLVPLLAAEEDLAAAVAGTTREPAAAEGATAWEVADIAVVVVEDAAAEE